ncbi:MAG: pantoate--beta-alanine ligase [Candidatus Omnitrophica bacterium]|nr:pantoate--beta-alanine ligase [Candidatus Omnitrophota bacterium]
MKVISSINGMMKFSKSAKRQGRSIGFVPTMGALHKGHFSLIRKARIENDLVIVSIFVNPAQFGPKEDFSKYPRVFKLDLGVCKQAGVDVVFYPRVKEMYPSSYQTFVTVGELSDTLCGKSRPGHFTGVATVVTKLFNIVGPDTAYFGQKDAQQSVIIRRLSRDLNFPVRIRVVPTVREIDGLAMSSRNSYLNQRQRDEATVLNHSLELAKDLIRAGEKNPKEIIRCMKRLIGNIKSAKIDYIDIVGLEDLETVKKVSKGCLIALAVWIGKTRLIDNIIIDGA